MGTKQENGRARMLWSAIRRGLDLFGPYATLIALVLAVLTEIGVRNTRNKLIEAKARVDDQQVNIERMVGSLATITQALTTQYVDTFPLHMDAIILLINGARDSLLITTDQAPYAQVSAPEKYKEMLIALQEAAHRKVSITTTIYGSQASQDASRSQFTPANWPMVQRSGKFRDWTKSRGINGDSLDLDGFMEKLDQANEEAIMYLEKFCGARVNRIDEIPFFAWIADPGTPHAVAIFSLRAYPEGKAVEIAFRTTDPTMVEALTNVLLTLNHAKEP